jgi:NAD+ diphosphatase
MASWYDSVVDFQAFDDFIAANVEAAGGSDPGVPSFWFVIRAGDLLVDVASGTPRIPFLGNLSRLGLSTERAHFLGTAGGVPCRAADVGPDAAAPEGWAFAAVRSLFSAMPDGLFGVIARALEIVGWDRTHRFCGACGAPTAPRDGMRAMECTACGRLAFTRLSPAVIMAVSRGPEILLARSHRFTSGMFSILAGFVEPGENLEQCVRREVREETGIEVEDIRYVASQPWPFPDSLMIGFTAKYASGEIRAEPSEIAEAGWFTPDALPALPDPISIARRLIDGHVARVKGGQHGH